MTRGAWVFAHLDRIETIAPTWHEFSAVAALLEQRAPDAGALKELRQMFGFERTPTPRMRSNQVTHGCAVGVRWHAEQQVPECRDCRRFRWSRTVHGTEQSCQAHYQDGTDLCDVCQALYDQRHTGRKVLPPGASCGSPGGFRRHVRLCEPICTPCRVADRVYAQENRLARQRAARATAAPPAAPAEPQRPARFELLQAA